MQAPAAPPALVHASAAGAPQFSSYCAPHPNSAYMAELPRGGGQAGAASPGEATYGFGRGVNGP